MNRPPTWAGAFRRPNESLYGVPVDLLDMQQLNNAMRKYYPEGTNLRYTDITHDEERDLFRKAKQGDQAAREFLIRNHLLLAANLARRQIRGRLPEDEVVSAANMGLMKAIDAFDQERSNRFSVYLPKYIRGEMRALWRSKNIVDQPEGGSFGVTIDRDEDTRDDFAGERIVEHGFEEADHNKFIMSLLEKSKQVLTEPEAHVIGLLFQEDPLTLQEIGEIRGVTRERIRQIKEGALKKLRSHMKLEMARTGVEK